MAISYNDSALQTEGHTQVSRLYAWTVFALTMGLALSDYMTRQVIGATFPFLKADWGLSDVELGALVSVVAVSTAIFAIPVSLVADRFGRVKSITAMAFVWCLATIACGMSQDYTQLLVARSIVGMGEAAYYSAGGALLVYIFPARQRATVLGIFIAGAVFGSVLGVMLGGVIANLYGWRQAFFIVGAPGLLLAIVYPFVVRDYSTVALVDPAKTKQATAPRMNLAQIARALFCTRSAVFVYLASGVQSLMPGVIISWMPSYMNRYYGLAPDRAGAAAAVIVLVLGVGMIAGGILADRLSHGRGERRASVAAIYSAAAGVFLIAAFWLGGTAGLVLLVLGVLLAGGHGGCSGAIITEVTHPGVRATVIATMTMGNSALGFATGPVIVGKLSDLYDLQTALCLVPLSCFVAVGFFLLVARNYRADSARFASMN